MCFPEAADGQIGAWRQAALVPPLEAQDVARHGGQARAVLGDGGTPASTGLSAMPRRTHSPTATSTPLRRMARARPSR